MKTIKNIIVIVMCLLMAFSFSTISFAQSDIPVDENIGTPPTESATQPMPDEEIAIIHFCAIPLGGYFVFGHAWIYIENISEGDIQVGAYTLPAGKSVSVGTSSFTGKNGFGLYYNLETLIEKDTDYLSIGDTINANELDAMNRTILNFNHWDPIVNCTFSSSAIWNSVSDKTLIPMVFPIFSMIQMWIHGNDEEFKMNEPEQGTIYVQKGFGKNATIKAVDENKL